MEALAEEVKTQQEELEENPVLQSLKANVGMDMLIPSSEEHKMYLENIGQPPNKKKTSRVAEKDEDIDNA